MHAQMEKMKSEGVVDIFQFIKSVRCQRAGLVSNKVSNVKFYFHLPNSSRYLIFVCAVYM